MDSDKIFALDIGTRKIVGLVMQETPSGYKVLDSEIIEHNTRAMMDGQIHDVQTVTATIQNIKTALEERLGLKLETAAIAAAGRALETSRGSANKKRGFISEISADEVRVLEIEAVQEAQYLLARKELDIGKNNYFCVGYSVIAYMLENQPIGNLVGQVGNEISVEVVATFLPRVVVDSLFSALKKADLDIYSMTLEPIAALSVVIPPNMRLLNLALVDIGAGTSDIAVVKNGNIFAYAMVPSGGDRLSEHIAAEYLMDFNSAERLKCQLNTQEILQFNDILGNQIESEALAIQDVFEPIVMDLSAAIARNILEMNGKTPDAVLCVGGGSLTPGLVSHLADALEMPRNRVGIRKRENFQHIEGDFVSLKGPQGVTPLGIAYNSFNKPPVPFIQVIVNNREVALWNLGEIDVASALLSSGISLNNAYGRPGMGKTLEINGYLKVFKGEMGTAPVIRINGKEATLDTPVRNGDNIEFTKGADGKAVKINITNINPGANGYVNVNGEKIELNPRITVNGEERELDEDIPDRAKVVIERVNRLEDILSRAGVEPNLLVEKTYNYYLNEQAMLLKWCPVKATVDGRDTPVSETVNFGSYIEYKVEREKPRIRDVIISSSDVRECQVTINGDKATLKGKMNIVKRNGYPVSIDDELYNGSRISVDNQDNGMIMSDVFQVVNIKPSATGRLIMKVNGEEAGYTTPIHNNSEIELRWE
ncbi:MAG: cell division FtsA domain-containing protein [Syntrophomonas sp.]|nr:cell division FtsA domain-containing protein [Syntrophomonas sp.]